MQPPDDVSEATIRMQGAGDTHVSQAMFIMTEVIAMLKEESHPIRVPNTTVLLPPPDGIPTESTQVAELTLEAQDVREVLLEEMEDKSVGKASLKVERLCALRNTSRKALGADQLVNGSAALKTRAEEDLKGVIAVFADAQTQSSAPVPAQVLDVEPAEPSPKKKRFSRLEERREARVRAAVGCGGDSGSAESQAAVTGGRVLIGREMLVYLAEQGQLDVDASNLLGFGIGGVPTAYAQRQAQSRLRRKCRIWRLSLGCIMGSRPPLVRPNEIFQRSPTSLVTCAVGCLQVRSSAWCSFG